MPYSESRKRYNAKNRDQILTYKKTYRETHKKQIKDAAKTYYEENGEAVRSHQREYDKRTDHSRKKYQKYKEQYQKRHKRYRLKNKLKIEMKRRSTAAKNRYECLKHYSRRIPKCSKCGLIDVRFLELDHVDNDGKKSRQDHGKGNRYYAYLIKTNFTDNLQVLCTWCNRRKKRK